MLDGTWKRRVGTDIRVIRVHIHALRMINPPPSRLMSRRASRRRVLPDLEGGIKILEVGTNKAYHAVLAV